MPKIGAHVSAAVSLETSLEKARQIGAEATQIFISAPQQWAKIKHDKKEIERYREKARETGIGPNFIHGSYLINLGSANLEHLQKSIDWLIYALNLAGELGIKGVIFHTGSHKDREFNEIVPQVAHALIQVLEKSNPSTSSGQNQPWLILETSAGSGNTIGDTFAELGQILEATGNSRLKVCLDTQHVFAAGYDIKSAKGLEKTLAEFDKEIGLDNLAAIHTNDSKTEFGSHRDRHENIGDGFIGREGFANLVNNPKLKDLNFILEVPGFSGNGPDNQNISLLKSLIHPKNKP